MSEDDAYLNTKKLFLTMMVGGLKVDMTGHQSPSVNIFSQQAGKAEYEWILEYTGSLEDARQLGQSIINAADLLEGK